MQMMKLPGIEKCNTRAKKYEGKYNMENGAQGD